MFAKTASMIALMTLASSAALAQGGPQPGHDSHFHDMRGPHRGMMPMLPGVTLTDDQKNRIHEIFAADHDTHYTDWSRERDIDRQIADALLSDGKIDRAKVASLIQAKDAIENAHEQAWLDKAIKVHDVLTPQQLVQARDTRNKIQSLREQIHALTRDAADHGPMHGPDAPAPE